MSEPGMPLPPFDGELPKADRTLENQFIDSGITHFFGLPAQPSPLSSHVGTKRSDAKGRMRHGRQSHAPGGKRGAVWKLWGKRRIP